jgi:hypothetical protein
MTAPRREVQYLVLPNPTAPFLLARVRWPDVYQAISPARSDWQDDPGLFDLPYTAAATRVTGSEAARIAAEWGARLPADDEVQAPGPSLIRRMPSDWSNLSAAERRAWSIGLDRVARSARHAAAAGATVDAGAAVDPGASAAVPTLLPVSNPSPVSPVSPASRHRRWARRRLDPVEVEWSSLFDEPIETESAVAGLAIDQTQPMEAVPATVDHA